MVAMQAGNSPALDRLRRGPDTASVSFFCAHFDTESDACQRLRVPCVPGRPGCVLQGKVTFLVPPAERVAKAPAPRRTPAPRKRRA